MHHAGRRCVFVCFIICGVCVLLQYVSKSTCVVKTLMRWLCNLPPPDVDLKRISFLRNVEGDSSPLPPDGPHVFRVLKMDEFTRFDLVFMRNGISKRVTPASNRWLCLFLNADGTLGAGAGEVRAGRGDREAKASSRWGLWSVRRRRCRCRAAAAPPQACRFQQQRCNGWVALPATTDRQGNGNHR